MKMFDQARDTEVEHANLLATLLRNQNLLTTAKTYYVCGQCGYTTDVALPLCALCRSSRAPKAVH
jgi:rubrerythrin